MITPVILSGARARGCGRCRASCIRSSCCRSPAHARCCSRRCCACRDSPPAPRSWCATRHTASWSPSSCGSCTSSRARHCWSPSAATPRRPSRWPRTQPSRDSLAQPNALDPVLLVLPADHVIRDIAAFQTAVRAALAAAEAGQLATFGIVASAPETGYGYIERGAPSGAVFRIARFIEKPNSERARRVRRVRRLLLEQRHVPVPRGALPAGTGALRAGDGAHLRTGVPRRARGPGFPAHRSWPVRSLSGRLDRLRGHGEDGGCGGRAAGCRLERRRLLVVAARGQRCRCARQRHPR